MRNTIVVDVDGTICEINPLVSYADLKPIQSVIDKVNSLYDRGDTKVILMTARGMRSCNGDLLLINSKVRPILEAWLNKNNVKYHELVMGKPWGPNVKYIDDNALRPDEFVEADL